MSSFRRLNEELALFDLELASFEILKFHGQKEKFMSWLSKVEQVFACYNLNDREKFKVVIPRLRSCALQWWKDYKFKRKKKGKEKVRTWKKLRSKLMVAFCPPTYILKHVSPLPKKNGSESSCMNFHLNKGSSIKSSPIPFTQPKIQPQISPPPALKSHPLDIIRCSKCQGFGHSFSDCVNKEIVSLAEWTAMNKEETQEEEKQDIGSIEEIVTPPDEGEMLLENRDFFGYQRSEDEGLKEEDPKEDPVHNQKSIIFTPTIPSKFPPQNSQPPQNGPPPDLITPSCCLKCQDLGYIALEYPNGKNISLAACEAKKKEEEKNQELCLLEEQEEEEEGETSEVCVMEEVEEDVKEGGLLVLRRSLPKTEEPLKDGGVLSSFLEPNPKAEPYEFIVFSDSNLKPSPQKECPNSPQELRTILFKERGNDVYSLGAHDVYSLWFEFHDKRHVMEFYLARTKLKQANSALGTSPGTKSAFVYFLVQDLLDQINFFSFYL